MLFTNYFKKTIIYIQPVISYWQKLSEREKKLLTLIGILLIFIISFFIISGIITWTNNLTKVYISKQKYMLEAGAISKQYKDIMQTSSNEFSVVKTEQIKNDLINLLDNKNPYVTLENNNLTINLDSAKFDSVMLLLDQLRKTYGIFPNTLKFTKISSGYVSFNGSFIIYDNK